MPANTQHLILFFCFLMSAAGLHSFVIALFLYFTKANGLKTCLLAIVGVHFKLNS